MKKIAIIIVVGLLGAAAIVNMSAVVPAEGDEAQKVQADSLFELAVNIIKKYETLHQPRHWPLVGYGHQVLPGEKFSRTRPMAEADAEALLRKDLLKNCAVFRSYGRDSLLLGVLAYNIGSGATKNSSVARKLAAGDRNIEANYLAHCKYRGKQHAGIRARRVEEFNTLFFDLTQTPTNKATSHESTDKI